jgi:hypothetical protein
MTPTIEDVLKKHGFYYEQKSYTVDSFALYDAAKAAMTEYASLNRQGCRWVKEYRKYLQNHIAEGKKFLKNDVGILQKSDIAQTKSFTRGKHTGFVYALDKFNELSATESIEPCATSSEKEFKEKVMEIIKDNIHFAPQVDGFVVHGAIDKIWELHSASPTGDRDDEWMKENPPFAAPYPKEKRFYIDEVGELLRKHKVGELSISKMTEILNEKIK